MLGSAKTKLPPLTLTSWVKGISPFANQGSFLRKWLNSCCCKLTDLNLRPIVSRKIVIFKLLKQVIHHSSQQQDTLFLMCASHLSDPTWIFQLLKKTIQIKRPLIYSACRGMKTLSRRGGRGVRSRAFLPSTRLSSSTHILCNILQYLFQ